MGKKTSRSKKTKHLRPPLSWLDKSIYFAGLMFSFVVTVLLGFFFKDARDAIAFRDTAIVAYTDHLSFFFAFPFIFYLVISAITFFSVELTNRKPLFGNRKIRYGEYPWEKGCYPLFSRERKSVYIRPAARRFQQKMLSLWFTGLILSFCLLPLSFCGRTCLREDQMIISYNMFNQPVEKSYSPADFSELSIQALHVKPGRGAAYWKYEIIIVMTDGKKLVFSNRDFRGKYPDCIDLAIHTMTAIKARFPGNTITIKGADHLDEVAKFLGMDIKQTAALYRLFDRT